MMTPRCLQSQPGSRATAGEARSPEELRAHQTPSATGSPRPTVASPSRAATRAGSLCLCDARFSYAAGAATTARAALSAAQLPTRPRPAAAAAEDGAAETTSRPWHRQPGVPPARAALARSEATNEHRSPCRPGDRGQEIARVVGATRTLALPLLKADLAPQNGCRTITRLMAAQRRVSLHPCASATPGLHRPRSRRGSKREARRAECIVCARMRTCRRYNILYKPSLSFQLNRANTYRTY